MKADVPPHERACKKPPWRAYLSPRGSLSGRVLWLTVLCVLAVEALIFIPSAAKYRIDWMRERLDSAQIAALAVQAAPGVRVTDALAAELLDRAGVTSVFVHHGEKRDLVLGPPEPARPINTVDLREMRGAAYLFDVFGSFFPPEGRLLRVIDASTEDYGAIEMLAPEAPLGEALRGFAARILFLSLIISAVTGALVYFLLLRGVVWPILRITGHIEQFRDAPQDAHASVKLSGRTDEIGRAEAALADMERQVRSALHSNERLAALGGAVARIAHDLRNSLAAAQVVSERLSTSDDPKVRQTAPRLERALQRAVALAENALSYGRTQEPAPRLRPIDLRLAAEEAADEALAAFAYRLENGAPDGVLVSADSDHLHRILSNLIRNAAQALAARAPGAPGGRIELVVLRENGAILVEVLDDGPGVPARVQPHLFAPFAASTRNGGSGLGLAIARELARSMGGELGLVRTGFEGSVFRLTLLQADQPFGQGGSGKA